MAGHTGLSRRSVIAALPACTLAVKASAFAFGIESVLPENLPVLRVVRADTDVSAAQVVAVLRRASGCLRVEVYGAGETGFSIFQYWRTARASDLFWSGSADAGAHVFLRLKV